MKLNLLVLRHAAIVLALVSATNVCSAQPKTDAHPIPLKDRQALTAELQQVAEQLTKKLLEDDAEQVGLLSQRGNALFFLGEFKKSVADYEKMVELDPKQGDSHWRRGIARFYAGQATKAAQQFEAYHSFDDIDRENGIWRYFSQYRAYGPAKAKEGLLKYQKTDREPFPDVYRLFSGETIPTKIVAAIDKADISKDEREKRLFYAQLYIGLNHAVEGRDAEAIVHLRESTANEWGPNGGYGPRYMWHVGRVHLDLLLAKQKKSAGAASSKPSSKTKPSTPSNDGL
ncbi:MAG: tetratricopeptide repeat protein [Planctomycetales bacterium]